MGTAKRGRPRAKLRPEETEGRRLFADFLTGANAAEVARQLGTSREMVRRLAAGMNGPGIEMALRIERITYHKVPLRSWATAAKVAA